MRFQAVSLFLVAASLLVATRAASAYSAYSYPGCASDRGRFDAMSCQYNSLQCWVTLSGIGVCVPSTYDRPRVVSRRDRGAHTNRRH
jgi:hypothetical protein